MSKKLTPRKALQNLTEYLTGDYRDCFEELSILEDTIDDYENLKANFISMRDFKYKQLDALKIIKEKEVSVYAFKNWFKIKGNNFNYKAYLELQHDAIISLKPLSEDEFELLKEVLL